MARAALGGDRYANTRRLPPTAIRALYEGVMRQTYQGKSDNALESRGR